MFNKLVLVGNLTRDIELIHTNSGTALAKTAIATTRKFTSNGEKKEEVCFVDITFFGRSAEVANQYLRKGSKCLVEGRLVLDQWTDQQGQKRSKHSVAVESMQMLDTKQDNQQSQMQNTQAQGIHQHQQQNPNVYQPQQQQSFYQPPQQIQDAGPQVVHEDIHPNQQSLGFDSDADSIPF